VNERLNNRQKSEQCEKEARREEIEVVSLVLALGNEFGCLRFCCLG
jgi:hypothetical protein